MATRQELVEAAESAARHWCEIDKQCDEALRQRTKAFKALNEYDMAAKHRGK